MSKKPTHEDLGQRVKELGQEHGKLKQAEERLLQESTMRSILLDNLPCVALILKKGTREIVFSNQAAKQVGAIPGKTCYETWGQSDSPCPWCIAPKLWETGKAQHAQPYGLGRYWDSYWIPVSDDMYLHYAFDITKQVQKDEALRESEERMKLALEGTDEGIWDWDVVNGEITLDDNWIRLLGYETGEMNFDFDWWNKSIHPDSEPVFEKALNAYLEGTEKYYELEYQMRTKSGELKWIWARGICIAYDNQEKPLKFIGTHRDITERKQAEEALQESENKYQTLARSSPVGIYNTDAEGNCIYANERWCQITGLSLEETYGNGWIKGLHPDDREHVFTVWYQAVEKNLPFKLEYRLQSLDGTTRWVLGQALALKDSSGGIAGYVGTLTDITDRKKAEEALRQAHNELEQRVEERTADLVKVNEQLKKEIDERKRAEEDLLKSGRMNETLLDSLPNPALLINSSRTVIAANRIALEIGTQIGEYCWQTFGHSLSIPEEHRRYIAEHDGVIPPGGTKCTHCLADESLKEQKSANTEVTIEGTIFDTWWVPTSEDMFLHYAIDITERKQAEGALRESENRFSQLASGTFEAVIIHDNGVIILANDQFFEMFGYEPHELEGKDVIPLTATPDSDKFIREQISLDNLGPYEATGLKKDGTEFPMEIRIKLMKYHGRKVRMAAIMDLTNRKKAEKELEIKVKDLAELNAALKVLLGKRQEDQEEFQNGILTNIRTLIEPYLDKLKKSKLPQSKKTLLDIIESNLNEIISPFAKRLSSQYLNLTTKEIKIANLVKYGKTNKEIAEIQGVAIRTIAGHRENIRKKLGLTNKKANLKTYLQTLD